MATTRKPLPVGIRCELHYTVGSHHYLLTYREGQEPQAREAVARWARNRDLAFSWTDASAVGEAIGYDEPDDDPVVVCDCETCRGVTYTPAPMPRWWSYFAAVTWAGAIALPWVAVVLGIRGLFRF